MPLGWERGEGLMWSKQWCVKMYATCSSTHLSCRTTFILCVLQTSAKLIARIARSAIHAVDVTVVVSFCTCDDRRRWWILLSVDVYSQTYPWLQSSSRSSIGKQMRQNMGLMSLLLPRTLLCLEMYLRVRRRGGVVGSPLLVNSRTMLLSIGLHSRKR